MRDETHYKLPMCNVWAAFCLVATLVLMLTKPLYAGFMGPIYLLVSSAGPRLMGARRWSRWGRFKFGRAKVVQSK